MTRLLTLFTLFTATLFAEESYARMLQQKAFELHLEDSKEWHLLLHYKPDLLGGYTSLVDDETFFIADNGKSDPSSELAATIASFFDEAYENNASLRTRCIFVERYHWLKETLAIDESHLPPVTCSRYDWWLNAVSGESIALIFPAAYMNNPSSMFGHTFLRIDKHKTDESPLLSYALNYAATTGNDNGVAFAIKGIFGGYPGYFSVLPYFEKIREYNDLEDRDIYEYRLNFTPEEIQRLIRHAWEMHFFSSDYFFFKENCSYNLLLLLEYARPSLKLSDDFLFWAIPSDTLRKVADEGLIVSSRYRPSKSSTLKHLIAQSTPESRELAYAIAHQKMTIDEAARKPMNLKESQDTFEIAYEYVDYLRLANEYPHHDPEKLLMSLLMKRSTYGVRDAALPPLPKPEVLPHQGHRTSRIGLGTAREGDENVLTFQLKPAYHELTDPQGGYLAGGEINFFDLNLAYRPEKESLKVRRLNLFDIKSLTPQSPFFRPISWAVTIGAKEPLEFEKGVAFIEGGSGIVTGDKILGYLFGTGSFETGEIFGLGYTAGAGLSAGLVGDITRNWRVHLLGEYKRFVVDEPFDRTLLMLEQNIALTNDSGVKIKLSTEKEYKERYETAALLYQYYF